jgi:hypothetical protein
MSPHVVHFAVKTGIEPGEEALLVIRELDTCYAECIETESAGVLGEHTLDGREVDVL